MTLLPLLARGQKTASWPKYEHGAPRIEYRPLADLLASDFLGDAHFAAYSVPSIPHRLCTDPPAYERIDGGVPMLVLLFDDDCQLSHRALGGNEKVHANDDWWRGEVLKFESLLLSHPGGFIYRTRGGARIVYRLAEPFVIRTGTDEHEWKRVYLSAVAYLARRFGILCDPSISDWPRLHRLPRVTRDGVPQRLDTIGDPAAVGVLDYDTSPEDVAAARECARNFSGGWAPAVRILEEPTTLRADRVPRKPRRVMPREITDTEFRALAEDLGRTLQCYQGRHAIHLAIAGACYARGVPVGRGEELARAICAVTGETDDRPQVWRTTADRFVRGSPLAGYGRLRAHWPGLADVIDTALPLDGGARAARDALDAIGIPEQVPAADAAARVRSAIESTPSGFSVLRVTEGAGKTQAATDVAIARALAVADPHTRSSDRTLIVTDKHAVALGLVERLRAAGVIAEYWRSVLAVKDDAGEAMCAYHVPVSALARGRQSPVAVFCEGVGMGYRGGNQPCPKQDGCPAYQGSVIRVNEREGWGPRVVVTVHAKLAEGLRWAGEDALVLLDEDPRAVESFTVRRADLDAAVRLQNCFGPFEGWRIVVLKALSAGLGTSAGLGAEDVASAFVRGCEILAAVAEWRDDAERYYGTLDGGDIARQFAARAAYQRAAGRPGWTRRQSWAPRPHRREHARILATGRVPPDLAEASLTHAVIAQGFAGALKSVPDGAVPHREEGVVLLDREGDERVLRVLSTSTAVGEALARYGPTVLLDATADLDALAAVAGRVVPATDIRVADGAPVQRRLLYYSGASRTKCLSRGGVQWDGLARYVRESVAWILEKAPALVALAVFTWKPAADVLRAAWDLVANADPVAVELLAPIRARGASVRIGHYGATRGRDDWKDADAYLSIGDPRPNLGASHTIACAIGLGDERDAVYRRATAAEASQAAGRARTPWRTRAAVHVHIGTVPPLSWDARAEVVELPRGVVESNDVAIVSAAVRVFGSRRLAGSVAGVSRATAWRAGLRDSEGLPAFHVSLSEEYIDRDTWNAGNGSQLHGFAETEANGDVAQPPTSRVQGNPDGRAKESA